MRLEDQAGAVARFFFFSLLEERVAAHATERAVAALKASGANSPAQLIALCKRRYEAEIASLPKAWTRNWSRDGAGAAGSTSPGGSGSAWRGVGENEMASWIRFSKEASVDERHAVIFSRILKFSDGDVASGLGVSAGTLRHRLGRGVRALGRAAGRERAS